ncbi:MAG: biotin/lipoyl-containing protein [Acidobacteriota bacterium]
MKYEVEIAERTVQVELEQSADRIKAVIDGTPYEATLLIPEQGIYTLLINDRVYELSIAVGTQGNDQFIVRLAGETVMARVIDRKQLRHKQEVSMVGAQSICAPMPGRVVQVIKATGDTVKSGEGVVVVEAMKMQNEISAPKAGIVSAIKVVPGQTVVAGEVLAIVD